MRSGSLHRIYIYGVICHLYINPKRQIGSTNGVQLNLNYTFYNSSQPHIWPSHVFFGDIFGGLLVVFSLDIFQLFFICIF